MCVHTHIKYFINNQAKFKVCKSLLTVLTFALVLHEKLLLYTMTIRLFAYIT